MLLNTLQCTGWLLTTKNHPDQNVNSAAAEKLRARAHTNPTEAQEPAMGGNLEASLLGDGQGAGQHWGFLHRRQSWWSAWYRLCPGPGAEGPLVLLKAEGRGFARHEMRSGGGTRGQGLREQGFQVCRNPVVRTGGPILGLWDRLLLAKQSGYRFSWGLDEAGPGDRA